MADTVSDVKHSPLLLLPCELKNPSCTESVVFQLLEDDKELENVGVEEEDEERLC